MAGSTIDIEVGSGDRLSFTLFLAIVVHSLIIFGITFKIDEGQKVAPTLNITLATHKSKTEPEKADFLAQFDQEASGTSSNTKELSTVVVSEIDDVHIREINTVPQQRATTENINNIQLLASTSEQQRKALKVEDPNQETNSRAREGEIVDAPIIDPEIASLKAKLERQKQELAKQPRIRRLTSVSTKSSYDAEYLHNWTQKVEAIGNENFPQAAISEGIFGQLRVSVLISPEGHVEKTEILQSSGYSILDDAAIQIVKLSSPFARFPPEIRKNADKLEIIRTWRFEITGLKTTY